MLALHHYPCSAPQPLIPVPLVLLHGWGCGSSSWSPIIAQLQTLAALIVVDLPGFGASAELQNYDLDPLIEQLAVQLPKQLVVMGWSLGGMLAVHWAARLPQQVAGVITLAANAKFVASSAYPSAMPAATHRQFMRGFAAEPEATLRLFGGLVVQGAQQERQLLKQWRTQPSQPLNPAWLAALELLAALDNRPAFAQLHQPGLHLLADKDALVPAAAAKVLAELNPQQQLSLIADSAHAIHWCQPELVIAALTGFLTPLAAVFELPSTAIDKHKIAQSFSRAASTYDAVAGLQRDVGEQLMGALPKRLPEGARILDVGSGTGFFTRQLAARFSDQDIVGLDIAEGMLVHAAVHSAGAIAWLCGDAEQLPLADKSVDLIFSSLAIQWCNQLPRLMRELQRVLKPGGQVFIATLGPATLHELKSAWQQVDSYVHVNRFQPLEALRTSALAAGLGSCELRQELRVLYFERLQELTRELKALGAHNMNAGQPGGLTGRVRIAAFKAAYEQYRGAQGLPASYDVIYFSAVKPLESL
jgi:malonyl-CoA O-methyltransferase